MDKLLPCPFCNRLHAPSVHTDERGFFVWCDTNYGGCGSRGAVASTSEGAIIVWNYRTPATIANSGVVTVLRHKGPLPSPAPDIISPLANAPADPALLALARLGALMCRDADWPRSPDDPDQSPGYIDLSACELRRVMDDAGLLLGRDGTPEPGVRAAIAALLAPDGAGEVTP